MNQLQTINEIEEAIHQNNKLVIYYFSIWCGTCEFASPEMVKFSQKFKNIPFY